MLSERRNLVIFIAPSLSEFSGKMPKLELFCYNSKSQMNKTNNVFSKIEVSKSMRAASVKKSNVTTKF